MTKSVFSAQYERLRTMLIEARKAAGLTQEALAARLARLQSFVSKYERGERRLDVIEFLEVAKAVGFDPHVFLRRLITGTTASRSAMPPRAEVDKGPPRLSAAGRRQTWGRIRRKT